MPQIQHPAFVHQPNGIIYVCDGENEASFANVEAFRELEPAYALPAGLVALNVEIRGESRLVVGQAADGSVTRNVDPAPFVAYIAKAADYAAALGEQDHPLYGIADLAEARAVMVGLVKAKAHDLLASTDWYIIRQSETAEAVPADVLTARSAIRTASNDHETAINAASLETLMTYDITTGW